MGFRRPLPPYPIERYEVVHPSVPAGLDGLTVLQVTDLHVRKGRPLPPVTREAVRALETWPADMAVFTGDYMNRPGDEGSAMVALRALVGACRTRLGVYGVFGNHDTWALRREARSIAGITWMADRAGAAEPTSGLRLVGTDEPEDLLSVMVDQGSGTGGTEGGVAAPFTIALVHYPTEVVVGADLGIPVMIAGHTHGGQFRLTRRIAPHTSCDLPADRASGILRVRGTVCCISRGLGNAVAEVRLNCPAQVGLYVMGRGELGAVKGEGVAVEEAW